MTTSEAMTSETAVPAELTSWVIWLRTGAVLSMIVLLVAAREFAHLPIPLTPLIAITLAALLYNSGLALAARRAETYTTPTSDRIRAWVLYVGGVLDIVTLALLVSYTGGLISPWLYFFIAGNVGALAILPPRPARILTAVNAAAALLVVALPALRGTPMALSLVSAGTWVQPAYAIIVAGSLIGLMGLTAYAVSVPVEDARAAARFQEGLVQIAVALQASGAGVEQIATTVCAHAHEWFHADCTALSLLDGEELVVRAAAGIDAAALRGRRTAVGAAQSLDGEVLRRRTGFYVNHLQRSVYRSHSAAAGAETQAIVLVPLIGSLGVLGVLSLADHRRGGRFTATVLQRLSMLAVQAGVAVENARLLDRVREEADSVTALLRASERLTQSEDLTTLLTDLNQLAAETTRCDRSTTFLWDADRSAFYFGSTFGNPAPLAEAMRGLEFPHGFNAAYIERVRAGETFVITAEQAQAQLPVALQHTIQIGASAIVPLLTERALQGVMTVSYLDPARAFSSEQLWTLRGIARHAALAIERARLRAKEQEATATAEALVAVGHELSATLDRRQVLARLPQMAATAAACDFAILAIWDPRAQRVRILGAHGFSPPETESLLNLSLHTTSATFTDVFSAAGLLEIPTPQALPQLSPTLMEEWGVTSLLSVRFGTTEIQEGSLTIGYRQRTGPFSAAQQRLVSGIAQQAAVALENARLVEDLRQANRLKSDFLSTVSHELRTPLNAIIGYGDLLREGALGALAPEQLEAAQVIAKKGEQLLELINTTLDLTRLEAGQVTLQVSDFTLADVLAEIQQELADEVPPTVELRWHVAPTLPRLQSDRNKLKTVLKNLTHNALKFTSQGSVEVRAAAAPTPGHVQVVVEDTGIGIAAENVEIIFEMFRQLEPALTRHFGGVGLGLYIVQRLLDLLRGGIEVQSEPGRGSTFTVTIPANPPP